MTLPRRDQLLECNTAKESLRDFQETWCKRCVNPECTRSMFGQSRFDVRVNTWEDRLFKNPPRMDSSDPLYNLIAGKKFLTIETGRAPEIRGWVDPSEPVEEPVRVEVPPVKTVPTVVTPTVVTPTVVAAPEKAPSSVRQATVEPAPTRPPDRGTESFPINTQFQGGRMLNGVRGQQAPPRDPWAAPTPAENIVPVGGRVKFKGGG